MSEAPNGIKKLVFQEVFWQVYQEEELWTFTESIQLKFGREILFVQFKSALTFSLSLLIKMMYN